MKTVISKKTILIINIYICLILTSCNNKKITNIHTVDMESVDAIIDIVTLEQYTSIGSEMSDIIIFSRDSCEPCVKAKPYIDEALIELAEEEYYISYFDTDDHREEENFDIILDKLKVNSVPSIIVRKSNSEILENIEDIEILTDPIRLLEEIQIINSDDCVLLDNL